MVKVILFFGALILCACSPQKGADLSEGDRLGNQAIIDFGRKMKGDGLSLIGFGGGEKDGKTWELEAVFRINTELTVENSRNLMIKSIDCFLSSINNNELLRPYLSDYPYTPQNIRIQILGTAKPSSDNLSCISFFDSEIRYRKDNPNGGLSITILKEGYEEALQKLEEQNKKQSLNVL